MSQVVDERIVEMRFDNENFEKNVQTSLSTLEELKKSLKFENADKSLADLSKAANNVDFSNLDKNIQLIADRFSATGIATMKIITDLTALAERSIGNVLSGIKSMISTGGLNRALKIEKAKFQLKGLGVAWKDIEEDINYGVQDTAYGLDAAANVASILVTSGVKLGDEMRSALRGISGVAAMTGSTYEDIGNIFTNVSGYGKLMTNELRMLEMRGLNAAATIGKSIGKTESEVRELVSEGKIGFNEFATAMDEAFGEHAKEANTTFTGAMENVKSAFARIGELFYKPLIQDGGPLVTFLNIIRTNINELKTFLTPIIKNITNFLANLLTMITALGAEFKKLNGWKNLWQAFANILKSIYYILGPIILAFGNLFSFLNGTFLAKAAEKFKNFTEHLLVTKKASQTLYTVCLVLVAGIKSVGYILQFAAKVTIALVKALGSLALVGAGLLASLLDTLKPLEKVSNLLYKLTGLTSLTDILSAIGNTLRTIATVIAGTLVTAMGVAGTAIGTFIDKVSVLIDTGLVPLLSTLREIISAGLQRLTTNISKLISAIRQAKVLSKAVTVLKEAGTVIFNIAKGIAAVSITGIYSLYKAIKSIASISFTNIKDKLSTIFNDMDMSPLQKVIETVKAFGTVSVDSFSGVISMIGSAVSKLVGYLSSLQIFTTIKNMISTFASALGKAFKLIGDTLVTALSSFGTFGKGFSEFLSNLLAQASKIDLVKAITILMAVAMLKSAIEMEKAVIKVSTSVAEFIDSIKDAIKSFVTGKVDTIADSMLKIAKAVGILAVALFALSKVPVGSLIKASAAIAALGAGLYVFYKQLNKIEVNKESVKAIANIAKLLISVSASVAILAGALKLLEFSAGSKTLGTQVALLGAIIVSLMGVAVVLSNYAPEMSKGAAALLLFSLSVGSIANSLSKLKISEDTDIVASLEYFGTILIGLMALITTASHMSLSSAVGVVLIVAAITRIADAIKIIGESDLNFNYIKQHYQQFIVILGFVTAVSIATKTAGKWAAVGAAAAVIIAYGLDKIISAINTIKEKAQAVELSGKLVGVLATAVVGVAGLLALASAAGKTAIAGAVGVALISAALSALIGVAALLVQNVDSKLDVAVILGIVTVLSVLAGGLVKVTEVTAKAKTGPILAMIVVIAEIVTSLTILSVIGTDLIAPTVAFCAILNYLGKAMLYMSASADKVSLKSVTAMLLSVGGIATSLYFLKDGNWATLLAAAVSFRICMITIVQAMSSMSKYCSRVKFSDIGKLATATLTLIPIAISMRAIAGYDWASILAAGLGLSAVVAALGAALKLASGISIAGAIALDVASLSLLAAAGSISMIAQYDWENIKGAIIAMSTALLAITAVTIALGSTAAVSVVGVAILAAGLVALAVPMAALALVGFSFAAATTAATDALKYLATVDAASLNNITTAIQGIGLAIGQGLANVLIGFGSQLAGAIGTLVKAAIATITKYVPNFISGGISWIKGLVKGFADKIGNSTVVRTIISLVSSIISTVGKYVSYIVTTGKNLLLGFIKGITDGSLLRTIISAAGNIGKMVIEAIKDVLGIHSPSKQGANIGKNFDYGVLQGMQSEEGKVFTAGQSVGQSGLRGLWSNIKSFFSAGVSAGQNYLSGLSSTVKGYAADLKSNIENKVGIDLTSPLKGLGGVFDKDAEDFLGGLFKDIDIGTGDMTTSLDELMESAGGAADAIGGSGSGGSGSVASETKKSTDIMDYAADVVQKYADTYKELFKTLDNGDPLETSKSAVLDFAKTVYEASGNIVEDTEDGLVAVLENFQSFEADFKKSIENQLQSVEAFTEEFSDGAETIIDNLDANKAAVDNWFRYLKLAADNGIDQKTLINLCQAGFSSETYAKLRTYATMSSKQVAMFNQSITEASSYSADKVTAAMSYLTAKQQEGYGKIDSLNGSWREAWKSSCDQTYNEIKTVLEKAAAIYDEQVSIIKDKFSGTIASFTEFTEEENAQSISDMKEALQSRIDAANEYSSNIQELLQAGSIDQTFADYLLGLGWEDGYSKVKAMVDATSEEVEDLVDTWNTAIDMESIIPKDLASQYAVSFTEGLPEALTGIAEATKEGILNDPEYASIGKTMCQRIFGSLGEFKYDESWGMDVSQIWDGYMESAGFSKVAATIPASISSTISSEESKQSVVDAVKALYMAIPENIDEMTLTELEAATGVVSTAFSEGIVKSMQLPSDTTATMAQGVVETASGILTYDQFTEIARNVVQGMQDAIADGKSGVVDEMRRMCEEAVEAAREELDINSPSKVMYAIGSYLDQGFVNGINDGSSSITESIDSLSTEAVAAFSNVVVSISDYLENGINAQPVISPVLDMSNMDAGLAYANSLAGKNFKIGSLSGRAYNLMSSIGDNSSDSSNTATGGNSYQFIQNNYSPKALSRVDIYRQTNNQFTRMKGLVETG